MDRRNFKVLVLGNTAVGKTAWLTQLAVGEFVKEHLITAWNLPDYIKGPTLTFNSTIGEIAFKTCEMPSFGSTSQSEEVLRPYTKDVDAVIIMYDIAKRQEHNLKDWFKQLVDLGLMDVPKIIVGNKSERVSVHHDNPAADLADKFKIPHLTMSVRNRTGNENPFLVLARKLTGMSFLSFIPKEPIVPPTVPFVEDAGAIELPVVGNINQSAPLLVGVPIAPATTSTCPVKDSAYHRLGKKDESDKKEAVQRDLKDVSGQITKMTFMRIPGCGGIKITYEWIPEDQILALRDV